MSPYLGTRPCIACEHFHERSCRHHLARDHGGRFRGMQGYMTRQPAAWPARADNDTCGWWRPNETPNAIKEQAK